MTKAAKVNQIADQIPQALSVYINQIVYQLRRKNADLTVLSLGEAYFDIPPIDFNDINIESGYHYADSRGIPELRQKLATYYNSQYAVELDPDSEILVSAGSKPIIYMCMLMALEAGDEVMIHEPAWLSYQEQVMLAGGTVVNVPFDVEVANFQQYISDKTKLIIINNPNNPRGKVYSAEDLATLGDLCNEHGIFLLVDEAYSDFVTDDSFHSAGEVIKDKSNLFIVNSLSKNFGMSGWRIGYVISSARNIQIMLKLNQHLITCAPTPLMMYLEKHFDYILEQTLPQAIAVTEKRQQVVEKINEMGMSCLSGSSTFYIFLDVSAYQGKTYELCYSLLLNHGIATVPGIAYGESTVNYIRLSVGVESLEKIYAALATIQGLMSDAPIDRTQLVEASNNLGIEYVDWE